VNGWIGKVMTRRLIQRTSSEKTLNTNTPYTCIIRWNTNPLPALLRFSPYDSLFSPWNSPHHEVRYIKPELLELHKRSFVHVAMSLILIVTTVVHGSVGCHGNGFLRNDTW